MTKFNSRLLSKLKNKEYRDGYVDANIKHGIAHQIRAMRNQRQWKQTDLAERCHTRQSVISRWEDPSYGKYSIETLTEIASAFDVALLVKFVPYSKLLVEIEDLSPEGLSAQSFSDELPFFDKYICAVNRPAQASSSYIGSAIGASTGFFPAQYGSEQNISISQNTISDSAHTSFSVTGVY